MAQTHSSDAPAPAKSRSRRLLVLIVIAGVTLGAGAVAAYVLLGDARPAESQPAADAPSGLVPLETFLVNIAGNEGRAYLRVTLKVLVADKHQAEQILENEVTLSLMRNAILETLAIQSADELATRHTTKER